MAEGVAEFDAVQTDGAEGVAGRQGEGAGGDLVAAGLGRTQ